MAYYRFGILFPYNVLPYKSIFYVNIEKKIDFEDCCEYNHNDISTGILARLASYSFYN